MSETRQPFGNARAIYFHDIECAPLGNFPVYMAFCNWLMEKTVEAITEDPELATRRIWCVITPDSFTEQ